MWSKCQHITIQYILEIIIIFENPFAIPFTEVHVWETREVRSQVAHTDVIGEEVWWEALGPVTERGVIVSVSPEHQQNPTDQHSRVKISRQATFLQNKPAEANTQAICLL